MAALIDNNIRGPTSTVCAELLSSSINRCPSCKKYRGNLTATYSRSLQQPKYDGGDTNSYVNDRYLDDPYMKTKLSAMRDGIHVAEGTVNKLKDKVTKMINKQGEIVDNDFQQDLIIMKTLSKHVMRVPFQGFCGMNN